MILEISRCPFFEGFCDCSKHFGSKETSRTGLSDDVLLKSA